MTHPEPHDLTALAYGLIEGAERDALLEHVAECDACRGVYDSYRDEQAAVRDSILADARSGAAEAKALESTLRMIGGLDSESEAPKRGRVIRMPLWLIAAEVAAVLAVAVGLFFILKPDDTADGETVMVADRDRAPAEVEHGVAYVQDDEGVWKQADAVPVDEWVRTGDRTFAFRLNDGAHTRLEPGSVFRITLEGDATPVIHMLRGNGTIDTSDVKRLTYVRAGETGFYAAPGTSYAMTCEDDGEGGTALRSWAVPTSIKVRVLDGDVMVRTDGEFSHVPLRRGEEFEWDGVRGGSVKVGEQSMSVRHPGGDFSGEQGRVMLVSGDKLKLLMPRFEEWQERWGATPTDKYPLRMDELRRQMEFVRLRIAETEGLEIDVRIDAPTGVHDTLEINDVGRDISLKIVSRGETVSIVVRTAGRVNRYDGDSFEALKRQVDEDISAYLDGVKHRVDDEGLVRIEGFTNHTGRKITVTQKSVQHATDQSGE